MGSSCFRRETAARSLTAAPATLLAVVVSPANATVSVGAGQQFSVTGKMSDGTTAAVAVTWTATGGTVTGGGLYTAGGVAGTYRVIAVEQGGTLADTSTVTVVAGSTLTAVEVTPPTAFLPPNATQQFTARGRMSDATTKAVAVTWTATGGGISGSGLYTAGAAAGLYRVVATQQGGTMADTSSVTVTAGAAPSPLAGDLVVQVAGVPAASPKYLLEDTDLGPSSAAGCPSDLVSKFSAAEWSISIPGSGCKTELSVFAQGFAPVLDLNPVPVLSGGKNVITEMLPDRWMVNLNVLVEYAGADAEAKTEVDLANILYDDNRMGIAFAISGDTRFVDPDPNTTTGQVDPLAVAIGQGCTSAAAKLALNATSPLTVIYVKLTEPWTFDTEVGHDCVDKGIPGLIFIREQHAPAILAHEIGHALSLLHVGYGNLLTLYGWTDQNLMQSSAFDLNTTRVANHFTVGQVYRANFHDQSWLNTSGVRSGPRKSCQDVPVPGNTGGTWPCPELRLEWP